ncbi:MAG: hypothetical protein COS30_01575 [Candidatus Portnoybacteria bacterium CG02_land_8_20_14_3_00_45_8]|uniref:DUF11 domain-containing protein n=1 Tax=Candidatus Portnoybacteria bacterium CG02_land_8_20_14_3_00_45_8 TaxID=1974807 RepID=A0A2M7D695_9BACT|nr:MAG: hypothetical protein COS30_01575 [Candidatus Portnoybacteria bacterium CG02_land_8_20_14_3_00_45_8]
MDLEDLKKRLYKKDGQFADRPKSPEEFSVGQSYVPTGEEGSAKQWQEPAPKKFEWTAKKKKLVWLSAAGLLAVAVCVAVGFYLWNRHSFDKTNVALNIYGQERIVSGEETTYVVRYKNNTKVVLKNAKLDFLFSEQSFPEDKESLTRQGNAYLASQTIGEVASGQEGQAEFKTRVLGDKDSQQKFWAKLSYQPANISSDFFNEASFESTIISVPLVINFDLPDRLVAGQTLNFSLKYLNTSDVSFSDLVLKIDYPADFIFDTALPSPAEGKNLWRLSEIGSREEGRILIKGAIGGKEGENKVFKAQIGIGRDDEFIPYAQAVSSPQLAISPLAVEQSLADEDKAVADLGQVLNYKLKYRNTTSETIGPATISVKINSQAVNINTITAPAGFFSSNNNTITWNTASLPELESLAPRQEGEVLFSLQLKDKLPVSDFADKNFTVLTTAQIDCFDVPLALVGTQLRGENKFEVKINSRLALKTKGLFNDSLLPNSGPLPPRVGQKTTYTIYWQVLNISNDLSNVSVEAYLPSYVSWQGKTYPGEEDIKYDAGSGKVVWNIGRLSAGVGVLLPVKQVAWQVGFTPSISQVGNTATIVKEARITGDDTFTGEIITSSVNALASEMPDDPGVGFAKGVVQN